MKAHKRLLALTAFLSVAVVGLTVALAVSLHHNRAEAASPPTGATTTKTSVATKTSPAATKLGEPMPFDEGDGVTGTASLNSAARVTKTTKYAPTPKHGAWNVINVTIESTGGSVPSNPLYWTLTDSAGYVYQPEIFAGGDQALTSGNLPAGTKNRGNVMFDAPAGHLTVTMTNPIGGTVLQWPITV